MKSTKKQKMIQEMVRDFARNEVDPGAEERDKSKEFPHDLVKKCAELGLMGVYIPDQYGGAGMDHVCYSIAVEELSWACAATGVIVSAHTSLACDPILTYGTEEQKEKFLTPLASGDKLGAFALTEPGAGTDAQLALAKKYGRDDKTANSHNYANGIMVAQVAAEVIRRAKAKGVEINKETLYAEMQAMNGYNAYYPLTTVGPVTYSADDHAGVDYLQIYKAVGGVFKSVGAPITSEFIKKI